MKRTLTLGLMIFFVGLLMTACGSDSSSPAPAPVNTTSTDPANTNTTINGLPTPTDVNQLPSTCNSSCGQTFTGRIQVTDKDAFAFLTGINTSNGVNGTVDVFDNTNPFGVIGNAIVGGAATCAQGLFPAFIAWAIDGNFELACGGSTTTTTTNGVVTNNGIAIQDFYNVSLTSTNSGWTGAFHIGQTHGGSDYGFEIFAQGNAWFTQNRTPPMAMAIDGNNRYYILTNINGNDVIVGYLIQ